MSEPTFTVGDTAPDLTGTCSANLTGATVELHIRKPDRTVVTKAATITDPTAGAWAYTWQVADLDQSGAWSVEAQVTYSNGRIQTFGPERFTVKAEIA